MNIDQADQYTLFAFDQAGNPIEYLLQGGIYAETQVNDSFSGDSQLKHKFCYLCFIRSKCDPIVKVQVFGCDICETHGAVRTIIAVIEDPDPCGVLPVIGP